MSVYCKCGNVSRSKLWESASLKVSVVVILAMFADQKDPDPRDYKDQKDPDPRDYKDVTEKFILQREKSQKKSTCNKRQQPDGQEGPQSTPKDPDARYPTTGRPLPRRPDIASPLTGPFDSVNSPRPIVLAPIENPNIPPSIDTSDEQKTDKKPNDKKKKKKKKKKMKDEEQDNPAYVQDN